MENRFTRATQWRATRQTKILCRRDNRKSSRRSIGFPKSGTKQIKGELFETAKLNSSVSLLLPAQPEETTANDKLDSNIAPFYHHANKGGVTHKVPFRTFTRKREQLSTTVFEKFHFGERFHILPFSRSVFVSDARCRVNARPKRKNIFAFS